MTKKVKFKKRYVLGTGYPWAIGTGPYNEVCLENTPITGEGEKRVELNWPEELWSLDLPQYRLVLERVEKGTRK